MKKNKRFTVPKQPPRLNVKASDLPVVECPKCKSTIFEQGMMGRYVSPLVNPEGPTANYAFQGVVICKRCKTLLPTPDKYVVEPKPKPKPKEEGKDGGNDK